MCFLLTLQRPIIHNGIHKPAVSGQKWAPATASATASTLRASADGAPVTSGSRLSDMAPCLVVEETDPLLM